jgi:hypothetical protein
VVAKRLDQLDRRLSRMERDIGISVETWPCSSGSGSHDAAAARAGPGRARHGREALRGVHRGAWTALAQGPKLRQEIVEDVGESPSSATRAIHRLQRAWINSIARPPFSCICTPRYYDDRYLLNRPNSRLF